MEIRSHRLEVQGRIDTPQASELVKQVHVQVEHYVAKQCASQVAVQLTRSAFDLADTIAFRLVQTIGTVEATEALSVPRSWWDHVKERFAPAWFLARWPVARTVYQAKAYLPEIFQRHAFEERYGPVVFEWVDGSELARLRGIGKQEGS